MSYLVDVLSARFVPQVWRTELMNQLSTHVILDPIGCLGSATDNRLSFGGQRSIQLSYGRQWASIDQQPAISNPLDIAGYCWLEGALKPLRQRSDVRIVSRAPADRVPRAC